MLYNSLVKLAGDFHLLESDGGTNTNVPNASDEDSQLDSGEKDVINKLDRSVKFDEVDTVTFGLETDDGKIVKVYVNAEQAEAFEKALATKLGEIDDIEEVLNQLSKEYEIVDVEWPEEGGEKPESKEKEGSFALDQRVYGKDKAGDVTDDSYDEKFQGESLNFGEKATLVLIESNTSIESRFTTASQLMVYHAILDLGIPEIALARNPYRAAIIKGIKDVAADVQKNASMKQSLKTFIRRAMDYEKKAEENVEQEKKETGEHTINKGVKEEMKININEEKVDWTFAFDKDVLTITSKEMTIELDTEQTERLIKGINNHEVTVVRDELSDKPKKYVFSPRGSSVLVKAVGEPDGHIMISTDVEKMLDTAVPDRTSKHDLSKDEEDVKEASENGYIGFYDKKQHEFYAASKYEALKKAREFFKAPKSKEHMVHVELAEKDGKTVIHIPEGK